MTTHAIAGAARAGKHQQPLPSQQNVEDALVRLVLGCAGTRLR